MNKRPNILFLMSDEHRHDIVGYNSGQIVRTPRINELASEGTVFENAYTPAPICVPARQCVFAGQYAKTWQKPGGGTDLPPKHMTYARRFAQYAYGTVNAGKLRHMGNDKAQGWGCRIGFSSMDDPISIEERDPVAFARYEASRIQRDWNVRTEIQHAGVGTSYGATLDAYAVDGAMHFIEEWFGDQCETRPLLLRIALNQPHYPFLTGDEKLNHYLKCVRLYENQDLPNHSFILRNHNMAARVGSEVTESEAIRAIAAYYGMIEQVDEHIGSVLDALEAVGQDLDEWIIVYTSDHGEMLGEHGLWHKQQFYEGSVRVPLVIRYGNKLRRGNSIKENVSLCDLFATLCELADIPEPVGLDSRSLVPLIGGHASDWDNEVLSQFGNYLMIKRGHLKYQYYGNDIEEVLFDLDRDPSENTNVLLHSAYQQDVQSFRDRAKDLNYDIRTKSQVV